MLSQRAQILALLLEMREAVTEFRSQMDGFIVALVSLLEEADDG